MGLCLSKSRAKTATVSHKSSPAKSVDGEEALPIKCKELLVGDDQDTYSFPAKRLPGTPPGFDESPLVIPHSSELFAIHLVQGPQLPQDDPLSTDAQGVPDSPTRDLPAVLSPSQTDDFGSEEISAAGDSGLTVSSVDVSSSSDDPTQVLEPVSLIDDRLTREESASQEHVDATTSKEMQESTSSIPSESTQSVSESSRYEEPENAFALNIGMRCQETLSEEESPYLSLVQSTDVTSSDPSSAVNQSPSKNAVQTSSPNSESQVLSEKSSIQGELVNTSLVKASLEISFFEPIIDVPIRVSELSLPVRGHPDATECVATEVKFAGNVEAEESIMGLSFVAPQMVAVLGNCNAAQGSRDMSGDKPTVRCQKYPLDDIAVSETFAAVDNDDITASSNFARDLPVENRIGETNISGQGESCSLSACADEVETAQKEVGQLMTSEIRENEVVEMDVDVDPKVIVTVGSKDAHKQAEVPDTDLQEATKEPSHPFIENSVSSFSDVKSDLSPEGGSTVSNQQKHSADPDIQTDSFSLTMPDTVADGHALHNILPEEMSSNLDVELMSHQAAKVVLDETGGSQKLQIIERSSRSDGSQMLLPISVQMINTQDMVRTSTEAVLETDDGNHAATNTPSVCYYLPSSTPEVPSWGKPSEQSCEALAVIPSEKLKVPDIEEPLVHLQWICADTNDSTVPTSDFPSENTCISASGLISKGGLTFNEVVTGMDLETLQQGDSSEGDRLQPTPALLRDCEGEGRASVGELLLVESQAQSQSRTDTAMHTELKLQVEAPICAASETVQTEAFVPDTNSDVQSLQSLAASAYGPPVARPVPIDICRDSSGEYPEEDANSAEAWALPIPHSNPLTPCLSLSTTPLMSGSSTPKQLSQLLPVALSAEEIAEIWGAFGESLAPCSAAFSEPSSP